MLGSGLLLAVAVLLPAAPAAAAGGVPSPGAPLGLTPGSGNVAAVLQLTTGRPCPAATSHVYAQLFGGSLPAEGQLLRDTSAFGFSTSAPFSTESSRRLSEVFLAAGTTPAAGDYVVELVCTDFTLTKLATFTTPLTFTTTEAWTSPGDGPQATAETLAAGDGSAPQGVELGTDDAASVPAPGAASAPGPDSPASTGAPAGDQQSAPPQGQDEPAPSPASGSTSGPTTLIGVALLGSVATAALLLGLPALRRRRAGGQDAADADAADRRPVSAGRTGP